VGQLSVVDVDVGQTATFRIMRSSGGAIFSIRGAELVFTGPPNSLNFESTKAYTVEVEATDAGGLADADPKTSSAVFTVTVIDAPDSPYAPVLSATAVDENQPAGTVVGVVSAVDVDAGDRLSFEIVPPSTAFRLADGGAECGVTEGGATACSINLVTNGALNHEETNAHTVSVTVTDSTGLTAQQTFHVAVDDVNEAPVIVSLDNQHVAENSAEGVIVGFIKTSDVDIKAIGSTPDVVSCHVSPASPQFFVQDNLLKVGSAGLDYESMQTHAVTITCSDDGTPALSATQTFHINVTDINEAPTAILISNVAVCWWSGHAMAAGGHRVG